MNVPLPASLNMFDWSCTMNYIGIKNLPIITVINKLTIVVKDDGFRIRAGTETQMIIFDKRNVSFIRSLKLKKATLTHCAICHLVRLKYEKVEK